MQLHRKEGMRMCKVENCHKEVFNNGVHCWLHVSDWNRCLGDGCKVNVGKDVKHYCVACTKRRLQAKKIEVTPKTVFTEPCNILGVAKYGKVIVALVNKHI